LERNYKYELLTEHDLGVTIDLILPETYELDMVDGMERLDPADEKLLEEELNPAQEKRRNMKHSQVSIPKYSVADPDPSDPYVFGPPGSGSGSISQRYGSGSGSFYHKAKIVRKTSIHTAL
jgi:hypothetical protein